MAAPMTGFAAEENEPAISGHAGLIIRGILNMDVFRPLAAMGAGQPADEIAKLLIPTTPLEPG